jgi:hypothetical protein
MWKIFTSYVIKYKFQSFQPQKLEDQILVFMSPSDRVAHIYPQAPGSLFVAFYDSHGCGGGILTFLHICIIPYIHII